MEIPGLKEYNKRHGGPWDRGAADSYYRRARDPHYYEGGTALSKRINREDMSQEEIDAYLAGYAYNEALGDFKDYGFDLDDYDEPAFEEDED